MDRLENRTITVTIQKLNKDNNVEMLKVFNNINTKFSYSFYIGSAMYGTGNISICGLDRETLDQLISFASESKTLKEKKLIKVEAGYGDKKALIIDGSIMSAIPTAPPDIWLNCEVINSYELQKQHISLTIEEGLTLEQYSQLIADTIGVDLEMRITDKNYLNKKMSGISFGDSIFKLVKTITKAFNFKSKDKNIYKYGRVASYLVNNTLVVDYAHLKNNDDRTQNPILISKDTGMVGLPEMSMAGQLVNITTLLKPEIKTGDVIKLESEQIKSASGLYYVQGITYTGEFRGNAWYSTLTCWRIN